MAFPNISSPFTRKILYCFMQRDNLHAGDNLHEMSKPLFYGKNKKSIINLSSAEQDQSVLSVNIV